MGKLAQEILTQKGMNIAELVEKLNKAYADEWLAYIQYWTGAQIAQGTMRPEIQKEMQEHAGEELAHAKKLSDRIIQLGGTPLAAPQDWVKHANCQYLTPANPDVKALLKQNIEAERCAIQIYNDILEYVRKAGDAVTFHIIRHILEEEMAHEQDLEDLATDIAA